MYNRSSSIFSSFMSGVMIGISYGSLFFTGFILGIKVKEQEYESAKTKKSKQNTP
jgi:hypothetical protein